MKTIHVPSGLGDCIWILQKLLNTQEQFHFILPGNKPRRGAQLFDLLPQIGTAEYGDNMPFANIKRKDASAIYKNWGRIRQNDFFLEANTHLEKGIRIEHWLPDLPTTYNIQYSTSDDDKLYAETITSKHDAEYIGIYGSAYSTQRAWGFWNEDGWFELIELMYRRRPDFIFVIIGADWDNDLGAQLIQKLHLTKIPYINTIGQSLGTVVEILLRLKYFIGFPSGLSILNETLQKDGVMFYPPHLKPMMNAWAHPERIESGAYKGCQFCTPKEIFNWIDKEYKLFE